jgi:hypothetical protein
MTEEQGRKTHKGRTRRTNNKSCSINKNDTLPIVQRPSTAKCMLALIGHLHCCIGVVVSLASLSSFWCQCCALLDPSTSFLSSYVDTLCSLTLQQTYMVYFCLVVSSLPCSMYFFLFNLCSPNFVVQCFWLEVL